MSTRSQPPRAAEVSDSMPPAIERACLEYHLSNRGLIVGSDPETECVEWLSWCETASRTTSLARIWMRAFTLRLVMILKRRVPVRAKRLVKVVIYTLSPR